MNYYHWSNEEIRRQVAVIDERISPTILLKNATYLNSYLKRWETANIWIYENRIVYIGEELPTTEATYELMDCHSLYLVPGYIEPHSHPFQVYNPINFSEYCTSKGTTTLINDNISFLFDLPTDKALNLLNEMTQLPSHMYWWCRLDSQTQMNTGEIFSTENMRRWLEHPNVLQAGELTAWPQLMYGDDEMLTSIQTSKLNKKRVEGHFPGASAKTLTKLMLLGAEADHEAMTAEEIITRLKLGYMVSLRQSSIRPDLNSILDGLIAQQVTNFNQMMVTFDGSHPYFLEASSTDRLIKTVMEKGIQEIDAYHMATFNVANYYGLTNILGCIAVGRYANINFLRTKDNPTPIHVMSKGKWLVKDHTPIKITNNNFIKEFGFKPLQIEWKLSVDMLNTEGKIGIELINDVISKPFDCKKEDCYLGMFDIYGKWKVGTRVKGFTNSLGALVSTYSGTGDIILIGYNKEDILIAFNRIKQIGGGIVLVHNGVIFFELALELNGIMTNIPMHQLIEKNEKLNNLMKEHGFKYGDVLFTLLFFSATHLPFIRLTPVGLFDIKKNEVIQRKEFLS